MMESNRINNLGVVEIQRASVVYDGMSFSPFTEGFNLLGPPKVSLKGPGIGFSPIWTNAGATTTKNLHIFFGEPIESVTAIERPDMRIPTDTKWIPVVIGPKARQTGTIRPITTDKLRSIGEGKLHIYLWGEATYHDIFQGTREHVTKFCQEIAGTTSTPNQEIITGVILSPCLIHNCIDEECNDQP